MLMISVMEGVSEGKIGTTVVTGLSAPSPTTFDTAYEIKAGL